MTAMECFLRGTNWILK